jgi:hypothetical protein
MVLPTAVFLDDHWRDRAGSLDPSEESFPCSSRGSGAGRCASLSHAELDRMSVAWQHNVDSVESAIVANNGFAWQSFRCIDGSDLQVGGGHCRAPTPAKGAACANFMRDSCVRDSFIQTNAVQYQISHQFSAGYRALNLPNFKMDLAIFLASRGPFSWLGYGWLGCGCGWSYNGSMGCDIYQRPASLDVDYGVPTQLCHETAHGTGIFKREWTKSTITVDCLAYTSEISRKAV